MHIPLSEKLKSIPGALGIRLEESLPYTVIRKFGDLEIRRYESFRLAQVRMSGDFESASESCFRILAGFIFGENLTHTLTEMTVPVFYDREGAEWVMSFFLPEEAARLRPEDSRITFRTTQEKTVAVLGFSGNFTEEKMFESRIELLDSVSEAGLTPVSDVWWAQYDQPSALPFIKKNEALVKVEELI